MGCSPASEELNKALRPIFQGMKHTFVIQDDLIVAGSSERQHDKELDKFCRVILESGMTLNPSKCLIRRKQIPWWGMIISEKGLSPDPQKVEAVKQMTPPGSKEEVTSFICMIQSDGYGRDFISNLTGKTRHIRSLLKKNTRFVWTAECQKEFEGLREEYKENIMMHHYDPTKETFIEVDASQSGLSAILQQRLGKDKRVVAVASRATTPAESRYPQLDLEALAIDYGLRRFRFYIAGGPCTILITDHKPLVSILKNVRKGLIRTERIKLRHQDIDYVVQWEKGDTNTADYLSRHPTPWSMVS